MPLSLIILLQVFAVVQGLWQNSVCFEPWNCPFGYSNNFISWNEMGFFNYIFLLFSSILFFIFIFILKFKKKHYFYFIFFPSWDNWNIVESGIKYHNPHTPNSL